MLHPKHSPLKTSILHSLFQQWFTFFPFALCEMMLIRRNTDAEGVRVLVTGDVRAVTQNPLHASPQQLGLYLPSRIHKVMVLGTSSFHPTCCSPCLSGDNIGPRWTFSKASKIDSPASALDTMLPGHMYKAEHYKASWGRNESYGKYVVT